MDLVGTAIPDDFAFNILLQNCVERQAVYERDAAANRSPSCPLAPCCLPNNEHGCSRSRPIPQKWSVITPLARTTSRSSARSDVRSTGSDSLSNYACSGIRSEERRV